MGTSLSDATDRDRESLRGGRPNGCTRADLERANEGVARSAADRGKRHRCGRVDRCRRVARAAPDGYTVSVGHWSTHVINGALYSLPYDLLRDLEPIALLTSYPMLLLTRNDVPAKNLTELTSWLKANQDKVSVGTIGVGSAAHVAAVYYEHLAGLKFQFVPYRGAGPALQDLMGGRIDLLFDHLPNALPQVREGRVKAFAVTANTRSPTAPEIPTVDEAGLADFTSTSGTASGSPRARRRTSRPSSTPLSWKHSPTRGYRSSSPSSVR